MDNEYDVVEETEEEEMEYDAEEIEGEDDDPLDFSKLFGDEATDTEEEQPEDEEGETVQTNQTEAELEADPKVEYDESTGEWTDIQSGEKLLPQSKVNEIIGSARIKGREYEDNVKYLEYMTGMPFNQISEYLRKTQVDKAVEENNMSPDQAERYVEDGPARRMLEQQVLDIKHQQQMQQIHMQREQEKAQYLHNPLVKKYEKEIDAIVDATAQSGQSVRWSVAMNHVIGEKALKGELAKSMEKTAKRKAGKGKRAAMTPESGGGAAPVESIPREIEYFANVLGEDPNESYGEYKKIQKEKELKIF